MALLAGLIPSFLLWSATPFILVPGAAVGWSQLFKCGLVGMAISVVTRLAMRLVLPGLISGWIGFGPIGVAMALMTWSGVVAVSWVTIACAGAIVWERSVPVGLAASAVEAGATRARGRATRRTRLAAYEKVTLQTLVGALCACLLIDADSTASAMGSDQG